MNYQNNSLSTICAIICLVLVAVSCSSCNPNGIPRPDAPLCTVTNQHGECTDDRGDFFEKHQNLMCTTLDGYDAVELYVDNLEKEVVKLRRNCPQ